MDTVTLYAYLGIDYLPLLKNQATPVETGVDSSTIGDVSPPPAPRAVSVLLDHAVH